MKQPDARPNMEADRTIILAALRGYEMDVADRTARLATATDEIRKAIENELALLEHAARTWPAPLEDYVDMMARPSEFDPIFQRDWWEARYQAAGVLEDFHAFLLRRGLQP